MSQLDENENEVDLREVFASLTTKFWFPVVFSAIGCLASGIYAFQMINPEFRATVKFEVFGEQSNNQISPLSALSPFAGLSIGGETATEIDVLRDRIINRPFVKKVYERADFGDDKLFNPFLEEEENIGGGMFERLFSIFGKSSSPPSPSQQDLVVAAKGALSKRLTISPGEGNFAELSITHEIPQRAADIANLVSEAALNEIKARRATRARDELNFFADQVLAARKELDEANAALNNFAITSNLRSTEELTRASSQLSQLRRELESLEGSLKAVGFLEQLTATHFDGDAFVMRHPVSNVLSFRRFFNFSAEPKEWQYPTNAELQTAKTALESQRRVLARNLRSVEERAKLSGEQSLKYVALEREANVKQALYESLISQFETQTVFSDLNNTAGEIIDSALPPKFAFKPRKKVMIAVGGALGLIIGCAIRIALSVLNGEIFTREAISKRLGGRKTIVVGKAAFRHSLDGPIANDTIKALDEIPIFEDEREVVGIVSPNNAIESFSLAVNLARSVKLGNEKIVVLDLTRGFTKYRSQSLRVAHSSETLDVFTTEDGVEIATLKNNSKRVTIDFAKETMDEIGKLGTRSILAFPDLDQSSLFLRAFGRLPMTFFVLSLRGQSRVSGTQKLLSVFDRLNVSEFELLSN